MNYEIGACQHLLQVLPMLKELQRLGIGLNP
jgi:hypothetical protein